MKKYLLLLLTITQFAFGQINTTTITAGQYKMNIPTTGVESDSAVVWNGASKLMKILPVSQIKGTTNLTFTATPTGGTVFSSTGTDAFLSLVTTINAGLQSPADKSKLDGIASGATANSTDAQLRDRATHTGTQAISTVSGLQPALDLKENLSNKQNSLNTDGTGGRYSTIDAISGGTAYKRTISQIRALSGVLPNNNFYTTDSGQEGNWYYDASDVSSADNTGTILVTGDGKRIKRVNQGFVRPEWFGAKGDFVQVDDGGTGTDDFTAIQAAINSFPNRNGVVFFTSNYRLSGTLQLGEGTHLEGQNTLFPKQETSGSPIIYKSKSALWFDTGVDGLTTTQDVVSYRNQGIIIEKLGIFSNGGDKTKIGLKLYDNLNAGTNLVKPGLPKLNACYFSGWDTSVDAKDSDSFDLLYNHFSDCRIGVIGGLSEMYAFRNDFFAVDETGLISNGTNDVITENEFEPTTTTGESLILNTASDYCMVSLNSFKRNKTAIVVKGNNVNLKGHHIISNNSFYSNYGINYLTIDNLGDDISITGNKFRSDNVNTSSGSFILASSGAKNIKVNDNSFEKRTGGLMTKTAIASGVVGFQFLNNISVGADALNDTDFAPNVLNTTITGAKSIKSNSNVWDDSAEGVRNHWDFDGTSSRLAFSNISSLFSYNGTYFVNFETGDNVTTKQYITGSSTPRFYLYINNGMLVAVLGNNTVINITTALVTNTKYAASFSFEDTNNDGDGTLRGYLNGVLMVTAAYTGHTSMPATFELGRASATEYFKGKISSVKLFNTVLSQQDIVDFSLYPSIPKYEINFGNNTVVNATTIIVGKKYKIETVGTTDYTLIGSSSNTIGVEFISTGVATGTGTVTRLGAVLDLLTHANSTTWFDISGNVFNLTSTNAVLVTGEISKTFTFKSNIASPTFTGIVTTPALTISTTPTTSAGTYDFITRNTSGGAIEKIPSANVATSASVALKADINSPVLTGNPTAPTPAPGDNDTSIATSASVVSAIAASDASNVKLTGNQGDISGKKSFNNSPNTTGASIDITNSSGNTDGGIAVRLTGLGKGLNAISTSSGDLIVYQNQSTGQGSYGVNLSSGTLSRFESATDSTGDLLVFTKNGAVNSKIDQNGNYIKTGGTNLQSLLADGTTLANPASLTTIAKGSLIASLTSSGNADQVLTTTAATLAFDNDDSPPYGTISRTSNTFTVSSGGDGLYMFNLQPQVTENSVMNVSTIWCQKNGVNVSNSAIVNSSTGSGDSRVIPLVITLDLVAGDQITFMGITTAASGATLDFTSASAPKPSVPSIIIDIKGWKK